MDIKLEEAILTIARFHTDNVELFEKNLKKAGTFEALHYHDDYLWIMPVFHRIISGGARFNIDKIGIRINDKRQIKWHQNKAETYFWACYYYLTEV